MSVVDIPVFCSRSELGNLGDLLVGEMENLDLFRRNDSRDHPITDPQISILPDGNLELLIEFHPRLTVRFATVDRMVGAGGKFADGAFLYHKTLLLSWETELVFNQLTVCPLRKERVTFRLLISDPYLVSEEHLLSFCTP